MRANRTAGVLAGLLTATLLLAGCGSGGEGSPATSAAPGSTVTSPPPVSSSRPVTSTPATSTTRAAAPRTSAARTTAPHRSSTTTPTPRTPTPRTSTPRAAPDARRLPLDLRTGDATQVITVVTSSRSDTTASVQRWSKDGSRWRPVGRAVDGYVGSAGVGSASEGSSKTPAGSFTLTQAFGRDGDPGTRLPYVTTTNDDYWISSPGPDYNTRQRCGNCGYANGVNEHLRAITPEYDQAVVIDYNTRNAPGGVRAGKGSAFFLHIANGEPTAGCVAVPRDDLLRIMRWLRPADDPRILIGVD